MNTFRFGVKSWRTKLFSLALTFVVCAQVHALAWIPSVNFAWNTSLDPTVTGYYLYYGTNSGVYPNKVDAGFNTAFTVSGFTANLTYYFSLTSRNAAGVESAFASEQTFIIPGSLTLKPDGTNGGISIRFPVAPTHYYELQASTNLSSNSWSDVWVTPTESSNMWVEYDQPITNQISKEFFRLILH